MAKKKDVTVLITLFWLLAMPFAFANPPGDITNFKLVTPAAQYKQLGGHIYCRLSHGTVNINVTMQREGASEYTMPAMMQFSLNGKPVGNIEFTGSEDPIDEFFLYYAEQTGDYYIFQEQYDDLMLYYDVYRVSGGALVFKGEYNHPDEPDGREHIINQKLTNISIIEKQRGAKTFIILATAKGEKLELEKDNYVSADTDTYINKPLLNKHKAFNWQKGFVPTLKNTIAFDLNGDNKPEKFDIDWGKKAVNYGNSEAMLLLEAENAVRYIRFEGDTLAFSMAEIGKDGKSTYTYYFSISPKYNTATLHKYSLRRYRPGKNFKGKQVYSCDLEQDYFPVFWGHVPTLERFSLDEKNNESFGHGWYVRKFTLNGLLKLFAGEENANDFPNRCAPVPDEAEIELLYKMYPLTTANVQQYNDLAYYMQEFDPQDDYRKDRLLHSSLFLLENITKKFPDRVVAWLNQGDGEWLRGDDYHKGEAKKHYNKYLALMQIQGKDMNKVPQRVYQRLKQ